MNILDLFCGAGGTSYGFQLHAKQTHTEHYIVGVDTDARPRKRYLKYCGDEFICKNVLSLSTNYLREFDFIWASPPCQNYVTTSHRNDHPNLVPPVRYMLEKADVPFVIENIPAAPFINNFITLCGTMFPPLRVVRHRRFEFHTSLKLNQPEHIPKGDHPPVYSFDRRKARNKLGLNEWDNFITVAGNNASLGAMSDAMGIFWMTRPEIAEAVPPKYSLYILKEITRALSHPYSITRG